MKPWARTGTPPGLPGQSAPRGEPGRLWCPANAQTGQRGAGGFEAGGPCSLWRRGEGSAVARRGPRASGEVEWRPHHHLLCEPELAEAWSLRPAAGSGGRPGPGHPGAVRLQHTARPPGPSCAASPSSRGRKSEIQAWAGHFLQAPREHGVRAYPQLPVVAGDPRFPETSPHLSPCIRTSPSHRATPTPP